MFSAVSFSGYLLLWQVSPFREGRKIGKGELSGRAGKLVKGSFQGGQEN